jgi:hypothetical protein
VTVALDDIIDIDAVLSLSDALNGRYAKLAKRLLSNAELCREERIFLANFIQGKTESPKRWQTTVRKDRIAQFLFYCHRLGPSKKWEAAVAQAMAHFKVTRTTVTNAWRELNDDANRLRILEASVEALRETR